MTCEKLFGTVGGAALGYLVDGLFGLFVGGIAGYLLADSCESSRYHDAKKPEYRATSEAVKKAYPMY